MNKKSHLTHDYLVQPWLSPWKMSCLDFLFKRRGHLVFTFARINEITKKNNSLDVLDVP